jgi:sugar diacid utilization regulator
MAMQQVAVQPRESGGPEEARIVEQHDVIGAFGDIAAAIGDGMEQGDLLRLIARRACEQMRIARCSIYLRDEETLLFRGQAGYGRRDDYVIPDAEERVKRLVAGGPADGFTQEIVATLRPVVVADAAHDPRPVQSTMRLWGIRSMLGVPMLARGTIVGIIFLDDGERARRFTQADSDLASTFADMAAVVIAQAQMRDELRSQLRTVAQQNDLLRRAAAMDDRFTNLVLNGSNIAEITATVAELTGKPCDVYDQAGHRLAHALPTGFEGATMPEVLGPAFRDLPPVRAALDAIGERASGVIGPLPDVGLRHRFLLAPIMTRDAAWGTLVIMETGSRFRALDTHVARRAAINVSLEMSAERRAIRAEWDARVALIGELIRGTGDMVAIRRRAEYLSFDLEAPRAVCLINADRPPASGLMPTAEQVAGAFAADGEPGEVLTTTDATEGILVVLELDPDEPRPRALARVRHRLEAVLTTLVPDLRVAAAVSNVCLRPEDYPKAHQQSRQVMDCIRTLVDGDGPIVLTVADLGAGRLLLSYASREEVDRFIEDALGPLIDQPRQMLNDLLETVRVYFATSRSVRHAARGLEVHENTIRYRLAKVEELTGLAIGSDADDELTAQTALLALRLRHWSA